MIAVLVASCTSKDNFSRVDGPRINTEKCKDAGFDLKNLVPKQVRSLVQCLNGENQAIQPLVDLLDEVNDQELSQILTVYNKHLYKAGLLNKNIDFIDRMDQRGLLKDVYTDIHVLTNAGVIQAALPILRRHLQDSDQSEKVEPSLVYLNRFIADLIQRNLITDSFRNIGKAAGSTRAKAMGLLLGRTDNLAPLNSNQVTDVFANLLEKLISEDQLHPFLMKLVDPTVSQIFRFEEGTSRNDHIDFLRELVAGSSQLSVGSVSTLGKMGQFVLQENKPLTCFKENSGQRGVKNLFDYVVQSILERKGDRPWLDRFLLVEQPLLISFVEKNCDRSPMDMTVIRAAQAEFTRLAALGVSPGIAISLHKFQKYNRMEYLKSVLGSPLLAEAGPVIENVSLRGVLPLALDWTSLEFTQADYNLFSQIVTLYGIEDLAGNDLKAWIQQHFDGTDEAALLQYSSQISSPQENKLGNLMKVVSEQDDTLSKSLRAKVAELRFKKSTENLLLPIFKKLYEKGEAREELKTFARALAKSFADPRGGIGDLLSTMAEGADLSRETPVQQFVYNFLADEPLANDLQEVALRIIKMQSLQRAVEFVGEMAGNGNLERIVKFLVEAFKQSNEQGLDSKPMPITYKKPRENPEIFFGKNPPTNKPPAGNYSACRSVSGNIFSNENDFYNAILCLGAKSDNGGLAAFADALKSSGKLRSFAELLLKNFMSQPNASPSFDQLEALIDSGDLRKLLEVVRISGESPYLLMEQLDPLLLVEARRDSTDKALMCVGKLLNDKNFRDATVLAIGAMTDVKPQILQHKTGLPVQVFNKDKLKSEAKNLIEDWLKTTWSDADLEAQIQTAVTDFENRASKENYIKDMKMYLDLNDEQMKDALVKFMQDLLLYTNLEELVQAFADFAHANDEGYDFSPFADLKGLDFKKFFDWVVGTQRVILYWPDPASAHNTDAVKGPKLRIMTRLDQLESLVLNSNTSIASNIPFFGVDHAGLYYQINVSKSDNLVKTIDSFIKTTELGISISNVGEKEKTWKLKNNLMSLHTLREMAVTGDLRIFQRLYQGLQRSTPEKYRKTQDPAVNQMDWAHRPMPLGFFARVLPVLNQLRNQGTLGLVAEGSFNIGRALDPKRDSPRIRALFTEMLKPNSEGQIPFRLLLDNIFGVLSSGDVKKISNMQNSLFGLIASMGKLAPSSAGVWEALSQVVAKPVAFRALLETLFSDLTEEKPDGFFLNLGNNILQNDEAKTKILRDFMNVFLSLQPDLVGPDGENKSCLNPVTELGTHLYTNETELARKIWAIVSSLSEDQQIKNLKIPDVLKSMVYQMGQDYGLRRSLAGILSQSSDRALVTDILYQAGQVRLCQKMSSDLMPLIRSGDLERTLKSLIKGFPKTN